MRRAHMLKKNDKAQEMLITVNAKCYNASRSVESWRTRKISVPLTAKEGLVLLVVNYVQLQLTALYVHKD